MSWKSWNLSFLLRNTRHILTSWIHDVSNYHEVITLAWQGEYFPNEEHKVNYVRYYTNKPHTHNNLNACGDPCPASSAPGTGTVSCLPFHMAMQDSAIPVICFYFTNNHQYKDQIQVSLDCHIPLPNTLSLKKIICSCQCLMYLLYKLMIYISNSKIIYLCSGLQFGSWLFPHSPCIENLVLSLL